MLLLAGRSSQYKTFRCLPQITLLASIWERRLKYWTHAGTAHSWVVGFFTNSKSVAPDLEQSTGFWKSGSRHNSQLLPSSDVSAEVQLQSCSAVPWPLLFFTPSGTGIQPPYFETSSLSPWYCLLLCELIALIRTCAEISGLPFVAGWRHAVS